MNLQPRGVRKGFGPFTGGQLTVIGVAISVLLLLPAGSWAAGNAGSSLMAASSLPKGNVDYNITNNTLQTDTCDNITPAIPAGQALTVTSVSVGVNIATTGPVDTWIEAGTPSSPCSVSAGHFIAYQIQSNPIGTMNFPLPSGVTFKSGETVSVGIHAASGDARGDVTVHGFLVPASQCQSAPGGNPVGCS
jgi:hypothetical protein